MSNVECSPRPGRAIPHSTFNIQHLTFMFFSVVIPTHNRLDMLLRVLDALETQADAPEFEVIVVNDGSTDDTERVLSARKGIVFRTQKNARPGAARNPRLALASATFA